VLRFRYASGGDRPLKLSIDGKSDSLVPIQPFRNTGSWTSWQYVEAKRNLSSGKHLVRLTSVNKTGPNVDRLEIIGPGEERKEKSEVKKVAPAPIVDDTWHFVTMTLNENKILIYLDGKLQSERSRKPGEARPSGSIMLASTAPHPRFYLDELRVYERPLAQDEIGRLAELRPFTSKKQ
jgi:hypothetical protein